MPIHPGPLSRAPAVFGELSVAGSGAGVTARLQRRAAGVWALLGDTPADITQMQGASPLVNAAVVAQSANADPALYATSASGPSLVVAAHGANTAAVQGTHDGPQGVGVLGVSDSGNGVRATSNTAQAVFGHSRSQVGVYGESDLFDGVYGFTRNPQAAGVSGHNPNGLAGFFDGDVSVTGDVILTGADCAEEFDIACVGAAEPGTVMSIRDDGSLAPCAADYDPRVAGVVSGAGDYRPAVILDKQETGRQRAALALIGKVYCKVDASRHPIATGDLLTTSERTGHAMKAADRQRSLGAIIGKALRPLAEGVGLIPILIALQ